MAKWKARKICTQAEREINIQTEQRDGQTKQIQIDRNTEEKHKDGGRESWMEGRQTRRTPGKSLYPWAQRSLTLQDNKLRSPFVTWSSGGQITSLRSVRTRHHLVQFRADEGETLPQPLHTWKNEWLGRKEDILDHTYTHKDFTW